MNVTGHNARKLRTVFKTLDYSVISEFLLKYKQGTFTVNGVEFKALGSYGKSHLTWFRFFWPEEGATMNGGAGAVAKKIIQLLS